MDEYRLLVEWKSGRKVPIQLKELRAVRVSRDVEADQPVDAEDEGAHTLEPAHLVDVRPLKDFLADITRTADEEKAVQLRGTGGQISRMFKLLEIPGEPPDPIPIPLDQ